MENKDKLETRMQFIADVLRFALNVLLFVILVYRIPQLNSVENYDTMLMYCIMGCLLLNTFNN